MTFDPIEERDATIAELRAEVRAWEDWSNRLAENIPDHYDGDDAQEAIIEKYVADLRAEIERLTQVVARRAAHAEQAEAERDAALVALASRDTYTEEGGLIVVGQLREQRARADAAESALRQVRELADEWEGERQFAEDNGVSDGPGAFTSAFVLGIAARDLRAVLDAAAKGAS